MYLFSTHNSQFITQKMSLKENYQSLQKNIPAPVTLVAVSKTKPVEDLEQVYVAGCRHFGENKPQEMLLKYETLPKDINWHMIGHLQSNKAKIIVPFVYLIHSVDSLKLLQVIDNEAKKNNKIQNCLLQIFIAKEETKFGLSEDELEEILQIIDNQADNQLLENISIVGFMGMASFTDDQTQIKQEFQTLKALFDKYQQKYALKVLSMGMSGDYALAIQEGSTMVRVGSAIFGSR